MLLALLLSLVVCTTLGLGVSHFWTSRATTKDLTLQLLDQTSLVIDRQVSGMLLNADHLGDYVNKLRQAKAVNLEDSVGFVRHLRAVMESSPSLTGIFLGLEAHGECIGVHRMENEHLTVWQLRRNPDTNHLEIREFEPDDFPTKPFRVDSNGDVADSRERPWYVDARALGQQTWSRAYPFFLFNGVASVPGITCATPMLGDDEKLIGVLGIDIRLDRLCEFLRNLRVGEHGFPFVAEIHPDGTRLVIAHPNPDMLLHTVLGPNGVPVTKLTSPEDISDHRVKAFMDEVPAQVDMTATTGPSALRFSDAKISYLGTYRVLSGKDLPTWLLCLVIPEEEILYQARRDALVAALIGVIVFLFAVLLSMFVSRQFARSLVQLVHEVKAVGDFQVEPGQPVATAILEVDQLARATEQMKTGLRSFGKYVPTDLVRKLLRSGVEARPGGEDRVLTIFFSDLANFTSISENLSPKELVEQLGEYFHAFTEEVTAAGGTVDKFIGDAVMAFWGAPIEKADHASAACRCALNCQRRLAELRTSWQQRGKPLLFARIGINSGPVVVGNIGSARRFNYTVIGDAVNVASRLEGLNKFYGTSICLSEETFRATAGTIMARPIDWVSVKGKATPTLVYELLGLAEDGTDEMKLIAALHLSGLEHYRHREWSTAIAEFEEILRLRANDGPATELLARCREFQQVPPGPDWDGRHRMISK
jgi:adenylate cyclase